MLHLAILSELGLEQVVSRINAYALETQWTELQYGSTVNVALTAGEHSLDVGHYGLKILALVQEHSVPVGNLVLPVLLPLAQRVLLEHAVSLDYQFGCGSLKTYTALDAYYRVAHVAVAAYAVGSADFLNLLYRLNLVVVFLAVHGNNLALLEFYAQLALLLAGDVLEVSLLGQTLCRVEKLAAADARAPDANVVRVFQLGEVGRESVFVKIVYLLLA